MARRDKRLIKPTFPNTKFGILMSEADAIKYEHIQNYKYTYFVKTKHGLREDDYLNHTYGDNREGYEIWQQSEDSADLNTSYSGVTSVRDIYKRDNGNNEVVGYVFEEKLSDSLWLEELEEKYKTAWILFCDLMEVKDEEMIEYILFKDIYSEYRDMGKDTMDKFQILKKIFNRFDEHHADYNDDETIQYRKYFNKLKG